MSAHLSFFRERDHLWQQCAKQSLLEEVNLRTIEGAKERYQLLRTIMSKMRQKGNMKEKSNETGNRTIAAVAVSVQ